MRLKTTLDSIVGYGLLVLVFLLPLFWLPFSFEAWEFPKLFLLFLFCSALAALKFFGPQERSGIRQPRPFDLPILLFLLVLLLSGLFSVDKITSIFGFYGRFSNGLLALFGLALAYFLVSRQSLTTNYKLLTALLVSGLAAMSVAFLAVAGVFKGLALPRNFNLAAPSLEGLAVFLVPLIFLALGRKGVFSRLFILLAVITIILIDYRPAWLVLALTSTLVLLPGLWKRGWPKEKNLLNGRKRFFPRKRLLAVFFLLVALLGLAINFQVWLPKVLTGWPQEATLDAATSWQIVFGALKARPIFGSGPGTFFYDFSLFRPAALNQSDFWQIRFDRPASQIGEALATTGSIGLLSYFALILSGLWHLLKIKSTGGPEQGKQAMLFPFLAAVIAQFVYYQNLALGFSFWLFLGVMASSSRQEERAGDHYYITSSKPKFLVLANIIRDLKIPFLKLRISALAKRIVFIVGKLAVGMTLLAVAFAGIRIYAADVLYSQALKKDASEQELQLLKKATDLNPYFASYQIMLSRSLLNLATKELGSDQQKAFQKMNQATLAAHRAVQVSPNWVAAWENLGEIYQGLLGAATGADQVAIKAFKKAIDLEPTDPLLYLQLGRVYFAVSEFAQAEEQFKTAVSLKLDFVEPQIFLALVKEKQGDPETAVKKLASLQNRFPLNSEVAFQLGRLYFDQSKNQEAISQFSGVLRFNPENIDALYSLALAYDKIGQMSEAMSYLKEALKISPDNETLREKLIELEKK